MADREGRAADDVTRHDYGFASHGAMERTEMTAHRGHTWGHDEHGIVRCTLCGLLRSVYERRRVQNAQTVVMGPAACGFIARVDEQHSSICTNQSPCAVHDNCEGQ